MNVAGSSQRLRNISSNAEVPHIPGRSSNQRCQVAVRSGPDSRGLGAGYVGVLEIYECAGSHVLQELVPARAHFQGLEERKKNSVTVDEVDEDKCDYT